VHEDYDEFGNASYQVIEKEYYEVVDDQTVPPTMGFVMGDRQEITNNSFDIHGRVESSDVINRVWENSAWSFSDYQEISYNAYDKYGNSESQTIRTYNSESVQDNTTLINQKEITNVYNDATAAKRGNASQSTTVKKVWDDTLATPALVLVEKSVTDTTSFDTRGNALEQTTNRSIYDPLHAQADTDGWVLETRTETSNRLFNGRGDAGKQAVETYHFVVWRRLCACIRV